MEKVAVVAEDRTPLGNAMRLVPHLTHADLMVHLVKLLPLGWIQLVNLADQLERQLIKKHISLGDLLALELEM